ncbi:MAG: hypothetical protein O3A46_05890 [Candidatus Poribacteria bacterium]|nr:hypothetical protein [Candidatus Poribacteria bacterium]
MNRPFLVRLALAESILLIPLVAMQFTTEVDWDATDFVVMGSLLLGAVLAYELVARRSQTVAYRAAVGVAVVTAFLLTWVNGAVGIIGDGPVNLMYGGVIGVGVVGAAVARLQSRGMAWALLAMAVAQMLVPAIALIVLPPPTISWSPGVLSVFGLNGVFAALWVGSALLFYRASITQTNGMSR